MIKFIFTVVVTLGFSISFGQIYNEPYGRPIVVLIETDPWLMVVGSDVPSFALYENGHIIYKKSVDTNQRDRYFEVKNDKEKTQAIIKSLGITKGLLKQPDYTEASSWTDQPTNILLLNFDTLRQIMVYGNLRNPKSEARNKTPKDFIAVYDNILKFTNDTAKEWLPDRIEILATNYSYSPEKPLKWNTEWGDLNSSTTVKRSDDLYSIYLDKKYFNDFVKLLQSLKQKQAVEINGKKYSLSYRLPFPNLR